LALVAEEPERASLAVIAREWGRIGCIGFGGPPAHIALLRKLCVQDRGWLAGSEFEDGVSVCNLLPGPASTQLAIYCAWRLRGTAGALVAGFCFIFPGLVVILALATLFLAERPPGWVSGAALGADAAVPAVALAAAITLIPASWQRAGRRGAGERGAGEPGAAQPGADEPGVGELGAGEPGAAQPGADEPGVDRSAAGQPGVGELGADEPGVDRPVPEQLGVGVLGVGQPGTAQPRVGARDADARLPGRGARRRIRPVHARWCGYLLAGGASGALLGPWLVLVLAACGLIEVAVTSRPPAHRPPPAGVVLLASAGGTLAAGGLAAVAWVAFKVGALSYGGGFVIIPLMQRDAVHTYHWMSAGQFLTAVALGQVTPGPVVQTVAVVGYAAAGIGGGLLASAVAFAPSFVFVLGGGRYFDRLRGNARVQAFLTGAGPAAIGAIAGAAVPLGLSLTQPWQAAVLALAAIWLIALRRGVVTAIVASAVLGVIVYLAGGPVT
jgi:chromate transporter